MSRTVRERLLDAERHFQAAIQYSQEPSVAGGESAEPDEKTVDAICMRIAAGVESLHALEPERRAELFGDAWSTTWGMRNRIAHTYSRVEPSVIMATVRLDLPPLLAVIRRAVGD